MNIWELLPHYAIRVLEYVPLVLLGAVLVYGVVTALQLRRLRGSTLDQGALFRHPHWPVQLRYPPWWEVRVGGDAVEFDSHEKDGVLRLTCRSAADNAEDVRDLVRRTLDEMRVALDEPVVRRLQVNPYPGAHASGFSDRLADTDAMDARDWQRDRCYAAAWAFRGPKTIAVLSYECSVLFGMVDGYYHDLMMPTLRLDDEVPQEPASSRREDTADTPTLSAV